MFTTAEDQIATAGQLRIPSTWPRLAAMDVSQSRVSFAWVAYHPTTDVVYVYDAYSMPRQDMAIHAAATKPRGAWIPVVFDMFAEKRSEQEGHRIVSQLQNLKVDVYHVPFDVEAAVQDMQNRFNTATLRVVDNLTDWFGQYRRLARNEKGQIDDTDSGILRATGLALAGLSVAITESRAASDAQGFDPGEFNGSDSMSGY